MLRTPHSVLVSESIHSSSEIIPSSYVVTIDNRFSAPSKNSLKVISCDELSNKYLEIKYLFDNKFNFYSDFYDLYKINNYFILSSTNLKRFTFFVTIVPTLCKL